MRWSPIGGALLGIGLATGLAGCAARPPAPAACAAPANAALSAELLFGMSIPGGGSVTAAEFDGFVAAELTPRFPDGLTVLPGAGQWRGPDGRIEAEGARLVMVIAPDTAETQARLAAVRHAYRARFRQRSVGLIVIQSCASF